MADGLAAGIRQRPDGDAAGLWRTVCRLTSAAQAELRDVQRAHIAVCTAIAGIAPPTGGRALWAQPRPDILVIQTGAGVPWMAWPRGWMAEEPVCVPVDLASIGPRVRFSLIANPTRPAPCLGRDKGTGRRLHGQRRPIPLPERDVWLRRRLGCLDIAELVSQPLGVRTGRKHTGQVVHTMHAWHGTASVVDPAALLDVVLNGVGAAKGYGAGMVVLS